MNSGRNIVPVCVWMLRVSFQFKSQRRHACSSALKQQITALTPHFECIFMSSDSSTPVFFYVISKPVERCIGNPQKDGLICGYFRSWWVKAPKLHWTLFIIVDCFDEQAGIINLTSPDGTSLLTFCNLL